MNITVELTEAEARVIKEILEIADYDSFGFCAEEIQLATTGAVKLIDSIDQKLNG